jgi:hypothetical protein
MEKRQGEGQQGEDGTAPRGYPPPGRGVEALGLATLVGVVAVLVISFASWRDVSRLDRRLRELEARLGQVATPPHAEAVQRGPDPSQVYPINTEGAPGRGKTSAPVTIAEFSDFQ